MTEVRRYLCLSNNIVYPVLQHRTNTSGNSYRSGKICLNIRPDVCHQSNICFVHQERKFSGHIIGNPDNTWSHNSFSFADRTGTFNKYIVRIQHIHLNLHRVHVVTFELNCSIEGIIATRKTVPGLRIKFYRHSYSSLTSVNSASWISASRRRRFFSSFSIGSLSIRFK